MNAQTPDNFESREYVSAGAVTLKGNRKGTAFHIVKADGSLGDRLAMARKDFPCKPGSVYTMPTSPDGQYMRTKQAKWVRTWDDADQLMRWRVASDATLAEERAEAAQAKGEKDTTAKALQGLDPIRRQYLQADRWGRCVIEALVLQYLRNPL